MIVADLSQIAGRVFPARRRTQHLACGLSPIQCASFACGHVTLEPDGGQVPWHNQEQEEIYFIVDGLAEMCLGEERRTLTSGQAVYIPVTPPSSVTLLDYFYPMVQGNEWEFDGTDYDGSPSRRIERVENLDWPVTVYTGRSAPRTYTTNLVRLYKGFAAPTFDSWMTISEIRERCRFGVVMMIPNLREWTAACTFRKRSS